MTLLRIRRPVDVQLSAGQVTWTCVDAMLLCKLMQTIYTFIGHLIHVRDQRADVIVECGRHHFTAIRSFIIDNVWFTGTVYFQLDGHFDRNYQLANVVGGQMLRFRVGAEIFLENWEKPKISHLRGQIQGELDILLTGVDLVRIENKLQLNLNFMNKKKYFPKNVIHLFRLHKRIANVAHVQ